MNCLARLEGPLFSVLASGKLGNFVYSNRKGVAQVRLKARYHDRKSKEQLEVRGKVAEVVVAWKEGSQEVKVPYEGFSMGVGKSGYSIWVGKYVGDRGFEEERFGESFFGR